MITTRRVAYWTAGFAAWSTALILVGCIDTKTMPVEYGAQSDPNAILTAINKPLENMKATDIQVGEFVAMSTSQDVALGQSISDIGYTGATITDKSENTDRVVYSGVLHQLTLERDGTYSKVSRDGEILCASKTPCACGECSASSTPSSAGSSFIGVKAEPLMPEPKKKTIGTESLVSKSLVGPTSTGEPGALSRAAVSSLNERRALITKSLHGYSEPTEIIKTAAAAAAPAVPTYHNFSSWVTREPPPANVASQPNCIGIPSCLINVHHVTFDEVYWDTPKGDRVHVETSISPDVPYLSRNLELCQSLLVKVGTDGSSVLLKQCSNVFDFRFKQE
jgi:hypothetical protein